jgi:hypothetical protein
LAFSQNQPPTPLPPLSRLHRAPIGDRHPGRRERFANGPRARRVLTDGVLSEAQGFLRRFLK